MRVGWELLENKFPMYSRRFVDVRGVISINGASTHRSILSFDDGIRVTFD